MGMIRGEFEVVEADAAPKEAAPEAPKEPTPPSAVVAPETTATYAVQRGDTLKSIAKKLYGDARRWRDIAAANPRLRKGKLKAGQKLNLPAPAKP